MSKYIKEVVLEGLVLEQTCMACPEQYEVTFEDKPCGYIRLRHGYLRADFPSSGAKTIYEASPIGDGCFNDEQERQLHINNIKNKIAETIVSEWERAK
jgi:hypothetical protein